MGDRTYWDVLTSPRTGGEERMGQEFAESERLGIPTGVYRLRDFGTVLVVREGQADAEKSLSKLHPVTHEEKISNSSRYLVWDKEKQIAVWVLIWSKRERSFVRRNIKGPIAVGWEDRYCGNIFEKGEPKISWEEETNAQH